MDAIVEIQMEEHLIDYFITYLHPRLYTATSKNVGKATSKKKKKKKKKKD
ncbi:hypothetical protein Sjap_025375 [Stephania japonica]|uniref:Uncharacterized protein n=1 Tax=Stephania japonica TaxID=461633 RepID=A0AAP0E1L3_9MAGN